MSARWEAARSRAQRRAITYFGEDVVYTPVADPLLAKTVRAVFDNGYEAVEPETGVVITSNQPRFSVILPDLPAKPAQNDVITRADGTIYKVSDPQPDGQGLADIYCHRTGSASPGPVLGGYW